MTRYSLPLILAILLPSMSLADDAPDGFPAIRSNTLHRFITQTGHQHYPRLVAQLRGYRQRLLEQRLATLRYLRTHTPDPKNAILPGRTPRPAGHWRHLDNARAKVRRLDARIAEIERDIRHFSRQPDSRLVLRP